MNIVSKIDGLISTLVFAVLNPFAFKADSPAYLTNSPDKPYHFKIPGFYGLFFKDANVEIADTVEINNFMF